MPPCGSVVSVHHDKNMRRNTRRRTRDWYLSVREVRVHDSTKSKVKVSFTSNAGYLPASTTTAVVIRPQCMSAVSSLDHLRHRRYNFWRMVLEYRGGRGTLLFTSASIYQRGCSTAALPFLARELNIDQYSNAHLPSLGALLRALQRALLSSGDKHDIDRAKSRQRETLRA